MFNLVQGGRRDGKLAPGLAVNTSMWARARRPVAHGPGTNFPPRHWNHLLNASSCSQVNQGSRL
jgi:hypothetical protein